MKPAFCAMPAFARGRLLCDAGFCAVPAFVRYRLLCGAGICAVPPLVTAYQAVAWYAQSHRSVRARQSTSRKKVGLFVNAIDVVFVHPLRHMLDNRWRSYAVGVSLGCVFQITTDILFEVLAALGRPSMSMAGRVFAPKSVREGARFWVPIRGVPDFSAGQTTRPRFDAIGRPTVICNARLDANGLIAANDPFYVPICPTAMVMARPFARVQQAAISNRYLLGVYGGGILPIVRSAGLRRYFAYHSPAPNANSLRGAFD